MGLATLQFLKHFLPDATIHYCIPRWQHSLFASRRLSFQKLLNSDVEAVPDALQVWRELLPLRLDWIFEINQALTTAKFFEMVSAVSRIPYFFHNHHTRETGESAMPKDFARRTTIQRDLDGAYDVFCRQLSLFSCEPPKDLHWAPDLAPSVPAGRKNQVVLGVVTSSRTKQWPAAAFARLSHLLHAHNPAWRIVIPVAAPNQVQELEREDFATGTQFVNLELDELAVLVEGSLCYAGNDTGLKHICAAMGIPTVTLFGPQHPGEWNPYDPVRHTHFFEAAMPCRYEQAYECFRTTCDSMACMNGFTAEHVAAAVIRRIEHS